MEGNDFMKIFSENLKKYMNEYQLTQRDLAKRLNVSPTSVNNWCLGYKVPRMDKVDAMCEIFHCGREDLMTEQAYFVNPETARTAQEIAESRELSLLFAAARDASPEDLMTTYNVLLALKKKERHDD